jgi:hypothetical protein
MGATRPPLDYLATCSQMSLESVELSRLNLASNLRKEFQEILNEWIDSEVDARLARSILEWRRAQDTGSPTPSIEAGPGLPRFEQLAIAFLPECRALPAVCAGERRRQSPGDEISRNPRKPSRGRKSGDKLASISECAPSAHRRDDKASRLIEAPSPRSPSLAKAAAVNLSARENLVELLSERLCLNRKCVEAPGYSNSVPQTRQAAPGRIVPAAPRSPAPKRSSLARLAYRAFYVQDGYAAQHFRVRRAG